MNRADRLLLKKVLWRETLRGMVRGRGCLSNTAQPLRLASLACLEQQLTPAVMTHLYSQRGPNERHLCVGHLKKLIASRKPKSLTNSLTHHVHYPNHPG